MTPAGSERPVLVRFAPPIPHRIQPCTGAEELAQGAPHGRFLIECGLQYRRTQHLWRVLGIDPDLQIADRRLARRAGRE